MNDLKNNEIRLTMTIMHNPDYEEPAKTTYELSVGDAVSMIDAMRGAVDALVGVAASFAVKCGIDKHAVILGMAQHVEQKYRGKEDTNA